MQENEIASLEGMNNVPELKRLHLQANKLEKLENFPDIPKLEVLALDGNPIAAAGELAKLSHLKELQELTMTGCPLADEKGDDFRKEVLIHLHEDLPKLKKINGEPYTDEELTEAMAEKETRRKEAENKPAEAEGEGEAKDGEN